MADKSLISRIFNRESAEIKSLKNRLDTVVGEYKDQISYEAKFLDSESTGFSGGNMSEFGSIDQEIDNSALAQIYSTETWVYTAVNAIAKTIAGLPIKLEKRKEYSKKITNEVTGEEEEVKQETWLDASGEKLFKIFQYPNPYCTKSELFMLLTIDLMTAGEYFLYLDSDEDLSVLADHNLRDEDPTTPFGRLRTLMAASTPIKGIYRIPPAMIKPVISETHTYIDGYAMQTDRGAYAFNAAEIIHVKLPNPNNNFRGLSPLIAAFKPVLMDRYSTEHMIRFYKSGARLGGVLLTEKSLNKEQLQRFQRSFENKYTGKHNAHRTLILPPGMDYKPVGANPGETSLLEFCKYNREAVLAAFNVPPIKVGVMEHANYANALIQLKMFFSDTIIPILTFIEDGFNMHAAMLPDSHIYRIKFDLSNVDSLQENFKEKADAAKSMIDAGLTVNEVRRKVWNVQNIDGGDKAKAIEDMNKPQSAFPFGERNFSPDQTKETLSEQGDAKEALPNVQADTALLSSIKPTDTTFEERVSQLVQVSLDAGLPLNVAISEAIAKAKLEGFDEDPDPAPPGDGSKKPEGSEDATTPDEGKTGIGTAQNPELVPVSIGHEDICDKCGKKDDCTCDEKDGGKPSLSQFISAAISKLDDATHIDDKLLEGLKAEYERQHGEGTNKEDEIKQYANGASKAEIVEHWKSFISKTDPLIEKRHAAVVKFFNDFKRVVLNRFGADLKSYGIYKPRTRKDADDILDEDAFKKLIDQYVAEVDQTLKQAYQEGYTDTLASFKMDAQPSEEVTAILRKYAASKVTGISDTTREQMRNLLVEHFEEGKSVAEVGGLIRDKFDEISQGRAYTIARTETLTAVSLGKEAKRDEFKKMFPEKILKKMWVSAHDDAVRESHQAVDGESVGVDESFSNGLRFPRDPDGDAEEVINCFYDGSYRVQTPKGWIKMKEIRPGDLVMTHTGEFKKVLKTLNDKKVLSKGGLVTIQYTLDGKDCTIRCTPSHRWLTNRGWIEARYLTEQDEILSYTPACQTCQSTEHKIKKKYYNACSRSCASKAITKRQWSDPNHIKLMSQKTTAQLNREYADGTRDPISTTKAANAKMRELGDKGLCLWPNRKRGDDHYSRKNPVEFLKNLAKGQKTKYIKGVNKDEKAFGNWLSEQGFIFKPQVPFDKYVVDFLIGDKAIEFDGDYWHNLPGVKEKDSKRDRFLKDNHGVTTIRIKASEFRYKYLRINVLAKLTDFIGLNNVQKS